jgi:hypothetical protein
VSAPAGLPLGPATPAYLTPNTVPVLHNGVLYLTADVANGAGVLIAVDQV